MISLEVVNLPLRRWGQSVFHGTAAGFEAKNRWISPEKKSEKPYDLISDMRPSSRAVPGVPF